MAPTSARRRRWGSFPTTADVGIWARGPDAAALLEALGLGLFALMTDLRRVRGRDRRTVRATGRDAADAAVAFLNALLVLYADDGFVARSIAVRTSGRGPVSVTATVYGEPFDRARHAARVEAKAVTLHQFVFDPARRRARAIVDI